MIVGCGRGAPLAMPVKGTVTFQGSPFAEADVAFTPKGGQPASGRTNPVRNDKGVSRPLIRGLLRFC